MHAFSLSSLECVLVTGGQLKYRDSLAILT